MNGYECDSSVKIRQNYENKPQPLKKIQDSEYNDNLTRPRKKYFVSVRHRHINPMYLKLVLPLSSSIYSFWPKQI